MRNCRKLWSTARVLCFAALAGAATITGCSEVNDNLGVGLIPDKSQNHQGKFKIESGFIETFVTGIDGMPTSNQGYFLLGEHTSSVTGIKTKGSAVTNLVRPAYASRGYNAKMDKIELKISIYDRVNNISFFGQEFNIFAVDKFVRDSVYTNKIGVDDGLYDPAKPIFSFKFTDDAISEISQSTGSALLTVELTPVGTEGKNFAEELWKDLTRSESEWLSVDAWAEKYKGLYIKHVDGPDNDLFLTFPPYIVVSYHNYVEGAETETVDATNTFGIDFANRYANYTGTAAKIDYDYSGFASAGIINDTLAGAAPKAICYIEPIGGMSTMVRFTDGFVEKVKAEITRVNNVTGETYVNMVVQKAVLRFAPDKTAIDNANANNYGMLNNMHEYLGSYLNISEFGTIADFKPEETISSSKYNGALNRVSYSYDMDISQFVQKLILDPENAGTQFLLAPNLVKSVSTTDGTVLDIHEYLYKPRETVLQGSASLDTPPQIEITYMLTK